MFSYSKQLFKISHLFPYVTRKINNKRNILLKLNISPIINYSLVKFYSSQSTDTSLDEQDNQLIEELCNGDKELEHKFKVLKLEMEVLKQEGKLIPDDEFMKINHWKELLKLNSLTSRRRYLEYLFKLSKKAEHVKLKRIQKQLERGEKPPKNENETLEEFVSIYDLSHNSIFLRFFDQTINNLYNSRLINAMLYGQKVVIDCGYDSNMVLREINNCAKQITLLFAENRSHVDPFDLYLCNANPDALLLQKLHRFIPTMYDPAFPLNIHKASYLDLFPKNDLVYLTPHCRDELREFDHDAIYIIGGIVDKINQEPLSLAKAKREGLKMAKFPLDRYLKWGSGSGKTLTLNQVLSILLDIKSTNDWNYALRHVPRRKLIDHSQISIDKKLQNKIQNKNLAISSWKPRIDLENGKTIEKKMLNVRSLLYDNK